MIIKIKQLICKLVLVLCLTLIRLYQLFLSPIKGHCCRFEPTCSDYAKEAFLLHGVRKGAILTLKRILKCHPWGGEGYDPVPEVTLIRKIK